MGFKKIATTTMRSFHYRVSAGIQREGSMADARVAWVSDKDTVTQNGEKGPEKGSGNRVQKFLARFHHEAISIHHLDEKERSPIGPGIPALIPNHPTLLESLNSGMSSRENVA
jgi:hypothetical protein